MFYGARHSLEGVKRQVIKYEADSEKPKISQ